MENTLISTEEFNSEVAKIIQRNYFDEVVDCSVYSELAKAERNPKIRGILASLSEIERKHIEVWSQLAKKRGLTLRAAGVRQKWKAKAYRLLRSILGLRITIRLLESDEQQAIVKYAKLLERSDLTGEEKALLDDVLKDEVAHEYTLMSQEFRVEGVRDVIYGVSDGLIEVLAVVSGFSGAFTSPLIVAVAGTIVGLSGALSMAVGAYLSTSSDVELAESEMKKARLQATISEDTLIARLSHMLTSKGLDQVSSANIARQLKGIAHNLVASEPEDEPKKSALYTAISYIGGAVIPVLAYLVGGSGLTAVISSYAIAAAATFIIGSIIGALSDVNPWRKGFQMMILAIGAALATHAAGILVNRFLHINLA
ncbi:MAG: VIT1/CCC1 transporter family protein [Thermoprotei archaeon]